MTPAPKGTRGPSPSSTASEVRRRVESGGERYWTLRDFSDLGATAVAHALARLASAGELVRTRKGLYYRPKSTVLGQSIPSASGAVAHTFRSPLHPAGLTAANVLGLTTQNPSQGEFATPAATGPGGIPHATIHTRRPQNRLGLSNEDGALLELLRDRASTSDLEPEATISRLVSELRDTARFQRLATAALTEPPRVRAMLGALGEQAGMPDSALARLRDSLNPLTRFEFGALRSLPNARKWQAK